MLTGQKQAAIPGGRFPGSRETSALTMTAGEGFSAPCDPTGIVYEVTPFFIFSHMFSRVMCAWFVVKLSLS